MSKLIVEVSQIEEIKDHPNADKMKVARIRGWEMCVGYDPDTGKAQFEIGDRVIYIPYDAVLPLTLANGPTDDPIGRLNVAKYCAPVKENGVLVGHRVRAARLRGQKSFGVIVAIDPALGDDPNWEVGEDVADHFGITKWEPPVRSTDGDAERPHARFHTYVDIERYANFPTVLQPGEEVVFTEKIHGKNSRFGLVLDTNDAGDAVWTWMAGSHGVRRKEFITQVKRFEAQGLVDNGVLADTNVTVGQIFDGSGTSKWKAIEIRPNTEDGKLFFLATQVDENGDPVQAQSEFWKMLTQPVRDLLEFVKDQLDWPEPKYSVILFGEIYGSAVQDLTYGMKDGKRAMRAFDIAVNGTYLDYEAKVDLCQQFNVPLVPFLYRGPFSVDEMNKHTDGKTTICEQGGKTHIREGVVIIPIKERMCTEVGRVIFKSVSCDYLARSGAEDFGE